MSPVPNLRKPFSNVQMELLKIYSTDVSEDDIKAIRRMLAKYFAEKASKIATQVWEEKGYDDKTLLDENMRTPYLSQNENVAV